MIDGKQRILEVLNTFTGLNGEPRGPAQSYVLKSLWIMMMSEFEASLKSKVECYIDTIKTGPIEDIHVCLLVRNFFGDKQEDLTLSKIVSYYKKNPNTISYRHFTQDRVPKYKSAAVEKLYNNLGIFLTTSELSSLSALDSMASTRDSIAHGDTGVAITRRELSDNLDTLESLMTLLEGKLL